MPWLMKAEPDSRIEKGKDVKIQADLQFSVDDFEKLGVSQWDGVRSHEARNIMRDKMKLGDKVLFYHSNTKVPGVYATAEVVREGYPDWSAWDPEHPYFDAKTDKDNPTWMMVDVKFIQRLAYPPTLALIKHLASISDLPESIDYIGEDGLKAVQSMQLVNRGRLSVQPVEEKAYEAVILLGTRGGWDELVPGKTKKAKTVKKEEETAETVEKKSKGKGKKASRKAENDVKAEGLKEVKAESETEQKVKTVGGEKKRIGGKKDAKGNGEISTAGERIADTSETVDKKGGDLRRSKRTKR